jgi:cytochrome c6
MTGASRQGRSPLFAGCLVVGTIVSLAAEPAYAQDVGFPPEQVRQGAAIYERNCSPCHGTRMQDPEAAFDLRKFPHEQHDRFLSSVTRGKNQMPPWGDLLQTQEVEALWAYVVAGER